jgi:Leucine-rich repeat (LRR) protein
LDLRKNQLLACDGLGNTDGLYNLPALRTLDLNTNKLTTLAGIKNLPALQELDVGANSIEKSDSLAGLINFTKLVRFNAAGNPFADELGDKIKFEVLFRIYPWV